MPDDVAVWLPLPVGSDFRSFQEKPQQMSPSVVPSERLHRRTRTSLEKPSAAAEGERRTHMGPGACDRPAEGTLGDTSPVPGTFHLTFRSVSL